MSITNEQAMQQLLRLKGNCTSDEPEPIRSYDKGFLDGMTAAYWAAGIITDEQYDSLRPDEEESTHDATR